MDLSNVLAQKTVCQALSALCTLMRFLLSWIMEQDQCEMQLLFPLLYDTTSHYTQSESWSMVRHYFGALLWRKLHSCQSGLLHECNLGGQGSSKILTDTRALMYPRPLKQMTQILTESRHLADNALQMYCFFTLQLLLFEPTATSRNSSITVVIIMYWCRTNLYAGRNKHKVLLIWLSYSVPEVDV